MVRRILTVALSLALVCAYAPLSAFAQDAASETADCSAKFTFSDSGIAVEETEGAAAGYTVSGTKLTIEKAGTYDIAGSCSDGAIEVKLRASVVKAAKRREIRTHRKLQWESSDTSVARVTASSKVKAKKAGCCYVYAYAQDGTFARCKVTVK